MTSHLPVVDARPAVRADCIDATRPCPWVACRHHLWLDSTTARGELRSKFEDIEDMPETCSLDVASRGALTAREIGVLIGFTHGRVQQIEEAARMKMAKRLPVEMRDAWTTASEASPAPTAGYELDATFKAQVQAAYERIVPASERGTQVLRGKVRNRRGDLEGVYGNGGTMSRWALHQGDCLDVLRTMGTHSVDAIVTDPPAGIGFMNAAWDKDKGGRDAWIAWLAEVFTEARRVAKPGAHALVWALPRTSHWTATGVEDAGWELRDRVAHPFGTGFPKSHNLDGDWDGWGTAMKPSVEDWHLARAPLSEGTVAANVAQWGCGALAIDACRIAAAAGDLDGSAEYTRAGGPNVAMSGGNTVGRLPKPDPTGRWPAHLVLSHNEDCVPLGTAKVKAAPAWNDNRPPSTFTGTKTSEVHHADDDGTETVDAWSCSVGCAVAMLDAQTGLLASHGAASGPSRTGQSLSVARGVQKGTATAAPFYADAGGPSRFFFCAKPSTAERELGLDGFASATVDDGRAVTNDTAYQRGATQRRNVHPTVKSVALMRWLLRLITPPDGLVLDLFTGSGTTGIAAMCEGVRFVGIEQEAEFARIARARIGFAATNPRAFDPETVKGTKPSALQVDLFGRTGT